MVIRGQQVPKAYRDIKVRPVRQALKVCKVIKDQQVREDMMVTLHDGKLISKRSLLLMDNFTLALLVTASL
jgi:hypothetical protein